MLAIGLGLYALLAIVSALAAVLATPYPWIALGFVGVGYVVYRERLPPSGQGASRSRHPLVVLLVFIALTGVIAMLLYALVMVLTIPAVWIFLGVAGAAYAIYRIARRIWRERLEVLFLDTIAALHASDPRGTELLSKLEARGGDDADAWLLLAAHAACRARYQDALAALERAAARVPSIGRLSSGMELAFPGLPAPLPFRPGGEGAGSIEVARTQIHVLDGRPRQAVADFKLAASDPAFPLGASALADAQVALGEIEHAAMALRQAADAPGCAPELSRSLRYKLARLLEDNEHRSAAIAEYQALIAQGGLEDVAERLPALHAHVEEERRHVEEERRREEEARKRQEQAQQREALKVAIAHAEKLGAAGQHDLAAGGFRHALKLPMDEETARAVGYKLAIALEDACKPMQADQEYEALGEYEDAPARREAIRAREQARREAILAEEEERRQRALRAQEKETLDEALAKLEAAKGPAGRRSAVRFGLERLTLQDLREQLLLEASQIEVDAVLEKVDGLKTAAAKRRHLLAALDAVRSDEVPDELQAQQIRWIEEALAALET
ncbi:hypothetical protein WMF11_47275 [Sorangium sp. So ce295]|uniref:hypothetical protein n=1 Tax=Sorangium sp. So ce295 TaxID=3133295 RepID=UPI003F61D4C3